MKLIHVYSDFMGAGDTYKRHHFTRRTWTEVYKEGPWVQRGIRDHDFNRSSKNIGDHKAVPFIRDIVQKGCEVANDSDLIVLTNADTCFALGITEAILQEAQVSPAFTAHRHDFNHDLYQLYTPNQVLCGDWYCGFDLFCFTKSWWLKYGKEYPDMLLGYEAWDMIFSRLITKYGGTVWNGMVYHRSHAAFWYSPGVKNKHPAQLHNIRLAQAWLKKNNLALNELARI